MLSVRKISILDETIQPLVVGLCLHLHWLVCVHCFLLHQQETYIHTAIDIRKTENLKRYNKKRNFTFPVNKKCKTVYRKKSSMNFLYIDDNRNFWVWEAILPQTSQLRWPAQGTHDEAEIKDSRHVSRGSGLLSACMLSNKNILSLYNLLSGSSSSS